MHTSGIKLFFVIGSLLFSWIYQPLSGQSRVDILGETTVQSIIYNGELPPLWHTALQEGRWNNLNGSQMLGTAVAKVGWHLKDDFSLEGMAEIDHSTGYDETYLHTGWVGLKWKSLSLKGGKHLFDPIFTDLNSGSGSYLFGSNYRPVSRVTLEMPAYTKVPYTEGRIEVRGGISQGWLDNQPSSGDVLLHEKYAYLRWDGGKWKPYAGLNHSSLFGGQKPGGADIPVDFMATFLGRGSEKIGGGEATNAAGAHMGLYDFGTWLNTEHGTFHFYYQIPFSDGSGMLFWQRNTDHVLGINWKPARIGWLEDLTFEWLQTTYQSGNGMPDPYMNGSIIFPKQVEDRSAFVYENFGIDVEDPLSVEAFKDILAEEINHGNKFGGRDGYFNNGMYSAGWTRNGHIMGSPFNMGEHELRAVMPGMSFNHSVGIKNDRFWGLHAGAAGRIGEQLKWQAKIAFTRNFGTYFEQYPGRYTWNEDEDYWFKGGRNQWYTMVNVTWKSQAVNGLLVRCGIAWDAGEIYRSAGVKTAVIYQLF